MREGKNFPIIELTPDILKYLLDKAVEYAEQYKFKEALLIYDDVEEQFIRVFGPRSNQMLNLLFNKAMILSELGRYVQCQQLYENLIYRINGKAGPNGLLCDSDKSFILTCKNNLALVLNDMGNHTEALELIEEIIEKEKELRGSKPEHESALFYQNNKATVLTSLGRYEEALQIYDEVIPKKIAILGEENWATLYSAHERCVVLNKLRRHDEALEELNKAINLGKEKLDMNCVTMRNLLLEKALTLFKSRKFSEAIEVVEQVLKIHEDLFGADHPTTKKTILLREEIAGKLK